MLNSNDFSEISFVYNFFKDGVVLETLEAKSNSEAFSKLHNLGYLVHCFDYFVKFCKINKNYELLKIK